MLTYAHVCSRVLTYAHVCSRMLTNAPGNADSSAARTSRQLVQRGINSKRAPPAATRRLRLVFFLYIQKKKTHTVLLSAQRPLQLVDSVFFFTLRRQQREQQRRVGNGQGRGISMRMCMSMRQQYWYAYAHELDFKSMSMRMSKTFRSAASNAH